VDAKSLRVRVFCGWRTDADREFAVAFHVVEDFSAVRGQFRDCGVVSFGFLFVGGCRRIEVVAYSLEWAGWVYYDCCRFEMFVDGVNVWCFIVDGEEGSFGGFQAHAFWFRVVDKEKWSCRGS